MWGHTRECTCKICRTLPRVLALIDCFSHLPGFPAYVGDRLSLLESDLRDEVSRQGYQDPILRAPRVGSLPPFGPAAAQSPQESDKPAAPAVPAQPAEPPAPSVDEPKVFPRVPTPPPRERSVPKESPRKEGRKPKSKEKESSERDKPSPIAVKVEDSGEKESRKEPIAEPLKTPERAASSGVHRKRRRSRSRRRRRRSSSSREPSPKGKEKKTRHSPPPVPPSPPRRERPPEPPGSPPRHPGTTSSKGRGKGRGWVGPVPRSSHPRWTEGKNKGIVKRAKQELRDRGYWYR